MAALVAAVGWSAPVSTGATAGRTFAIAAGPMVSCLDGETGVELARVDLASDVTCVAFATPEKLLALCADGTLAVIDVPAGSISTSVAGFPASQIVPLPDGERCVAWSHDVAPIMSCAGSPMAPSCERSDGRGSPSCLPMGGRSSGSTTSTSKSSTSSPATWSA
jgi:hypothetical protein